MTNKEVIIIMPQGSDPGDFYRISDAVRVASGYSAVTPEQLGQRREAKLLAQLVDDGLERLAPRLTASELEVLRWFIAGRRKTQIAAEVGITAQAVSASLLTIQRKLGVDNRVDLIRAVVEGDTFQPSVN